MAKKPGWKKAPQPSSLSARGAVKDSGPVRMTGLPLGAVTMSTGAHGMEKTATRLSADDLKRKRLMRHEAWMKKQMQNITKNSQEDLIIEPDAFNNKQQKYEDHQDEMVRQPSHYNQSGIECIDAIHACLGDEGFINYCHGNMLKYSWRWKYKGGLQDLNKSAEYGMFIENVTNGGKPRG